MNWLNAVTVLTGVVIIVVMIYACTLQVLQEASVDTPMLNVSKAWFLASMPVGLLLMLLHVLRLWLDKGPAAVFKGETESVIEGRVP